MAENGSGPNTAHDGERCFVEEIALNIHEIIWMFDAEQNQVKYVNPAYERITGLSMESLYSNPLSWQDSIHPDDRERVIASWRPLDREHSVEFRMLRPDGELRWVWSHSSPVFEDDRVLEVVGIVEDITNRKRAEQLLETSISLLRATLECTADGILVVDRDGRVGRFNQRFLEMWKIPGFVAAHGSDAELLAYVREQLVDPEGFIAQVSDLYATPEAESFDTLRFRDGRVFERYTTLQVVGGEVVGRVWSFRDVTERVRAREALERTNRRLELHNEVLLKLARRRIVHAGDLDMALHEITEKASKMLGTERVGVWLFDDAHTEIRQIEQYDRSKRNHTSGLVLERKKSRPYFVTLEQERTVAVDDAVTDPRTRDFAESYLEPHDIAATLNAPIRAGGRLLGVVCLEHVGAPRHWTPEERTFAGSIADLVSLAIESAELQRAEQGLRLLVDASRVLASSLDYRTTLTNVVNLVVPGLADWCLVTLIEDAVMHRVALAHADPRKQRVLEKLESQYSAATSPYPAVRVIRTGEPEIEVDVTDEDLQAKAFDDEHLRVFREAGVQSFMALPMVEAGGNTIGAITFVSASRNFDKADLTLGMDIAGRAAVAIDNARLHENANAASQAKSAFLAVMSHELRTPLSAITGYADLLDAGIPDPLTPKQKEQVGRIKLRAYDLLRVIEEILVFSRMEADAEWFRYEDTSITEMLEEAAKFGKPLVEERGLRFRIVAPEEPVHVRTDADKVRHILHALLSNAAKFTERGEVALEAQAGRDDGARIHVTDTGIGIAPEHRENVFSPFYQVEEALTREKGGTGIGLAIARRLARHMGGDLILEPSPEGSRFTLILPSAPPTESDRHREGEPSESRRSAAD